MNLVRGCKRLAETLGVHEQTVAKWRRLGVIDKGTVAQYGRVIIFDLDKVLACLNYHKSTPGRPKNRY